ncbi:unnamed protein product [Urochloa humidicola]
MATRSFGALRAIHLHFCPRLRYVLEVSSNHDLSNQLETLHIVCCGDLRHVFPVEQEFQDKITTSHETQGKLAFLNFEEMYLHFFPEEKSWSEWKPWKGMLGFPKLKHLYLHELPSLQLIYETKMFAPNLETIYYFRGCWGFRRLPATDARRRQNGHPVAVDWWDKLEWDGMESGHHPSLFEPRHSKYYKKRHLRLRATVLR